MRIQRSKTTKIHSKKKKKKVTIGRNYESYSGGYKDN